MLKIPSIRLVTAQLLKKKTPCKKYLKLLGQRYIQLLSYQKKFMVTQGVYLGAHFTRFDLGSDSVEYIDNKLVS